MTSIVLASLLCALPPARPRPSPPASDATPAASEQLSDQEIRERIDTFMGTIDTRISSDQWRALGPRGAAMLEQIAQDANVFPTRRAKAIAGLSEIGLQSSSGVLLNLAKSEQAPLTVRLAAVHGAPGVLPDAQVSTALKPVLETAKDGHVRGAAAEVLSRHGGCSLVRAQAQREDDRVRMQRALERCGQQ
jgi:HEAT repeat protein